VKERVGYREVERREGREGGRMGRGGRVRESKGVEGEERIGKGRQDSTWIFVQGPPSS